jgi:hypothetical protein
MFVILSKKIIRVEIPVLIDFYFKLWVDLGFNRIKLD